MQRQNRLLYAGFAAAIAALLLFGWLGREVLGGASQQFDTAVRNAIHAHATAPLTDAMLAMTQFGSPAALIVFTLGAVWILRNHGRPHAAVLLVICLLGGEALDGILKLIFRRPRPEAFFGYGEPASYSFPSGHSVAAACFYGVLAAILTARMKSPGRKAAVWAAAAVIVLAIGFSRVYLGVHHPTDVIAGYAAAIVWIGAVRASYALWLRRASGRARA